NASIESFFSLYKNESLRLFQPKNHKKVSEQIEKYMLYYNKQRYQSGLNEKTPHEIRLSM
ncbi:MAG: transposase, partial [Spiroplasma sp.]|nr:transposase [Mycoplasmatales bacterium]